MKEKLKAALAGVTRRQLRAFSAVVEAGSISKAAQRLNLTPPAVSLQMRQLEEAAGLPLLDRMREGVRPTDAGRAVLKAAGTVEGAMSACAEEIAALSGIERGRVAVGIVSTAKYFAPRALALFSREHPGVDVRLVVGNRDLVLSALRDLSIDLAITGRPPDDIAIDRAVIGDNPHIIIGRPGHPLAGKRNVPLARFSDETFLLREEGSGTRMLMERLFAEAGLKPNIGMEISSNETIKQAVMAGLGIALISAHTVAAELEDGRLIAFDVSGLPLVRQWFVIKRAERRLPPAAQALWSLFVKRGPDYLAAWALRPADVVAPAPRRHLPTPA